jgi:hypothetical protein
LRLVPAIFASRRSDRGFDVAADGPQEGGHLAGDRGDDDWGLLADGAEPTIAGAQADLRLPGDVANRVGQPLGVSPNPPVSESGEARRALYGLPLRWLDDERTAARRSVGRDPEGSNKWPTPAHAPPRQSENSAS